MLWDDLIIAHKVKCYVCNKTITCFPSENTEKCNACKKKKDKELQMSVNICTNRVRYCKEQQITQDSFSIKDIENLLKLIEKT